MKDTMAHTNRMSHALKKKEGKANTFRGWGHEEMCEEQVGFLGDIEGYVQWASVEESFCKRYLTCWV
jgi:hypothetical protein